jgi:hypothetical protein
MLGFFSGIILALWYRKEGPQQPVYEWLDEEEGEEEGNEVPGENEEIEDESKGRN